MINFEWEIKFEPRDLWIGVYWNKPIETQLNIYICIIPCVPICLIWWKSQ